LTLDGPIGSAGPVIVVRQVYSAVFGDGIRMTQAQAPATSAALRLTPVASAADMRRFLSLPKHLYRDDPAWIAPLELELRQRFSPKSHFLRHARWQGWVALRGERVVGRITAQLDDLEPEPGLGYFGMFECENDREAATQLTAAAERWLREAGARRVRGPLNLHINEEVGLLVEGFSTPPSVLMGHALPYYESLLLGAGLEPAKDLLAYRVHPDFEAPRVMQRLADRASARVRVRSFRRRQVEEEAELLRDIFNDAWAGNWGFAPMDRAEWLDTVRSLIHLMPGDYVQIAELDGEAVAFIVALPNVNEAARDLGGRLLPFGWARLLWRLKVRHPRSARVPLMGVRQALQHSRLGPTLAFMVIDAVRRAMHARGVREVEMSWILEDNDAMRNIIETIGGTAYKRYRLFEKPLHG